MLAAGRTGSSSIWKEIYTKRLSPPQQPVCRRVFQQLSEVAKGRAVRRRAEIGELERVCGQDGSAVVEKFREEGFLSLQSNLVDVTHECVLRGWSKARGWLEEEVAARDFYLEWVKRKSRAGQLLGSDLREVSRQQRAGRFSENWAARYGTAEDFVGVEEYVRKSRLKRKLVQAGAAV